MKETIYMIHGMWGGAWYWQNYKDFFESKGYHCLATILRFHDMNPKDNPDPRLGTTSLVDYIEDLEKELHGLGENPIIMGHSMGGLLAQILGSQNLAKALILLTPSAPAGIMSLKPTVIKSFWSGLTRWGFWKNPARQTFDEAVYSMLQLMSPEEQRKIYDKFVYESGKAACEIGFWLFDKKGAAKVDESKITCPVLVVAGSLDRITPASTVRKVAKKYQAISTYKEFSNHAHWVVGEPGCQEIAEYIAEWLDQIKL
jgi:pimeloyl-ACP methyl ester carboxylesterase